MTGVPFTDGREGERIVNAAVRCEGVVYVADKANGRHGDVIQAMHMAGLETISRAGPDNQGFITSEGRFVGRVEAKGIAVFAGQILEGEGKTHELYSEDVW